MKPKIADLLIETTELIITVESKVKNEKYNPNEQNLIGGRAPVFVVVNGEKIEVLPRHRCTP